MRRQYQKNSEDFFGARLTFVASALFLLMIVISLRLFVKAVSRHEEILVKAEQQYLVRRPVEPRRGAIYATDFEARTLSQSDGRSSWQALATNEQTYSLNVVPHEIKDKDHTALKLAEWAQMSTEELRAKIDNQKFYLPPLRKGLANEDKDRIAGLKLPGVFLAEEEQRLYPEQSLGSQLLGYVNAERNGTYGLEQRYDEDLRGSGGEILAERDARGRLLSGFDIKPVRDGSHLVLTIDRNVQAHVESTLRKALDTYQADSGSIVVMDVKTGGVVAMANLPDFNPNDYRTVAEKNELSRFTNPALQAVWEPGSIFKTLIMAAAVNEGLIEPETEGVFSNEVIVDGFRINTAEDKAFGKETMTQVLENSDNVAMVWIADKLGNEKMYDAIKSFGFGEVTGIDLPGEVTGRVPSLTSWRNTTRATLSFGQGISATPLQMTSALATLANGGKRMQPHIVQRIVGADGALIQEVQPQVLDEQVISEATALKLAKMMVSVVENGHGKRAKVPGYAIAGKTGTAQIPNPDGGGYLEDQHIGGFGGFFPADQPRFSMVVKLDRPKTVKFAESSAAPTFGEVAQFMVNYYRIPPTEPIKE